MVETLDIGGRLVGPGKPCYIIAEAGVNHNGSLELAMALVEAAATAGADAVKFQSFRAEEVAAPQAKKAAYQEETTGDSEGQLAMLKRLELSEAEHLALAELCVTLGITFLSTPFDVQSVDMLAKLKVPAFKVPSGEITNLPLLRHIGAQKRPVILSTGMSTLAEVHRAVDTIQAQSSAGIALLHCTSNYPAAAEEANLQAMLTMAGAFDLPVGYSDHTLGLEVPLAAVALGACIVEKHFTLDQTLPGPDHQASATPGELAGLVQGVRKVEAALGHGRKEPMPSEAEIMRVARRSLVAAVDIPAGARLEAGHIAFKRPGTGISPSRLDEVLGKKAAQDIPAESIISEEMLA